jgi:hypothetical protein
MQHLAWQPAGTRTDNGLARMTNCAQRQSRPSHSPLVLWERTVAGRSRYISRAPDCRFEHHGVSTTRPNVRPALGRCAASSGGQYHVLAPLIDNSCPQGVVLNNIGACLLQTTRLLGVGLTRALGRAST